MVCVCGGDTHGTQGSLLTFPMKSYRKHQRPKQNRAELLLSPMAHLGTCMKCCLRTSDPVASLLVPIDTKSLNVTPFLMQTGFLQDLGSPEGRDYGQPPYGATV